MIDPARDKRMVYSPSHPIFRNCTKETLSSKYGHTTNKHNIASSTFPCQSRPSDIYITSPGKIAHSFPYLQSSPYMSNNPNLSSSIYWRNKTNTKNDITQPNKQHMNVQTYSNHSTFNPNTVTPGAIDLTHTTTPLFPVTSSQGLTLDQPDTVGGLLRHRPTSTTPPWSPSLKLQTAPLSSSPLTNLLSHDDLSIIKPYSNSPTLQTILRSRASHDVHVTSRDLHDLISFNTTIYHELLVLALETLC